MSMLSVVFRLLFFAPFLHLSLFQSNYVHKVLGFASPTERFEGQREVQKISEMHE